MWWWCGDLAFALLFLLPGQSKVTAQPLLLCIAAAAAVCYCNVFVYWLFSCICQRLLASDGMTTYFAGTVVTPLPVFTAHRGGAIELSILSAHYKRGIDAYDIQTKRCDRYGEQEGYEDRVMLIYDGLHYDALAVAAFDGAPEDLDITVLQVGPCFCTLYSATEEYGLSLVGGFVGFVVVQPHCFQCLLHPSLPALAVNEDMPDS